MSLEVRLVAVPASALERHATRVATVLEVRVRLRGIGLVAGVVVLDLVVVPDRHPGMGRVQRLELLVGLVQVVLLPELGERLHVAVAVGAGLVDPVGGAGVIGVLIDVVAEADDQVEILLGHRRLGIEVAGLVVLAGEVGDLQRLLGIGRGQGAELPDLRVLVSGLEAVVVLMAGLEAGDALMDCVVLVLAGGHLGPLDDLAEAFVLGDLEGQPGDAVELGDPSPKRDRLGGREARGDAVGELAGLGERRSGAPRHRRIVERKAAPRRRPPRRRPGTRDASGSRSTEICSRQPFALSSDCRNAPTNDSLSRSNPIRVVTLLPGERSGRRLSAGIGSRYFG